MKIIDNKYYSLCTWWITMFFKSRSALGRSRPRKSTSVGVCGFLVYALTAGTALANWQVVPSVGAGVEYDDNATLNPDQTGDASTNGYAAEADLLLTYRKELSEFSVDPRVLIRRYDESRLDSEDFFVNLNYRYTGQRSSFRVRGLYGDETVRTAERADVDFDVEQPDEIPTDDSGRLLGTASRQRLQITPQWSYESGQRSRILFGANLIDISYDNEVSSFYNDYSRLLGTAGFEYSFSQRSALSFSGYYREDVFDDLDLDLSGYGATVGIIRSLSERTRVVFNLGSDAAEDENGDRENNGIGEVSLTHDFQTGRILASYRRAVTGSGAGELSVRDSINLNYTRNVSEKISVGGGVSAYQTSSLNDAAGSTGERDYVSLRGLLTWRLTRTLSVDLDYRYTNIDRTALDTDADSNRINLWFRYRGLRQ